MVSSVTQDTDFTKACFTLKVSHISRHVRECNFISGLLCIYFHYANCSTEIRADFLYRISPITDHNCERYKQKFI